MRNKSKCFGFSVKECSPIFEGIVIVDEFFTKQFSPANYGIMYSYKIMNTVEISNISWFTDKPENIVSFVVISKFGKTKVRTDIPRLQLESFGKPKTKALPLLITDREASREIYAKSYIVY